MADKKIDINSLGQALDNTWGRSSTPKTASYSVKLTMLGPDRVLASFQAIVNFGTERQMIEMKRNYASESETIISEVIKHVKASYKSLSGSSITFKEVSSSDEIEVIGFNVHNPKRTAYYRRKTTFEVG